MVKGPRSLSRLARQRLKRFKELDAICQVNSISSRPDEAEAAPIGRSVNHTSVRAAFGELSFRQFEYRGSVAFDLVPRSDNYRAGKQRAQVCNDLRSRHKLRQQVSQARRDFAGRTSVNPPPGERLQILPNAKSPTAAA